jgi:glycosyltransferase involved in cell wall biosynthesis
MRICLITSRIPPAHCGVGDYTYQLACALHARGFEVTILTGDDQSGQLPGPPIVVRNVLPGWGARGSLQIVAEVAKLKPDLIMVQWVPFLYNRFGVNFYLPMAALWLSFMGYTLQTMVHEPWVPLNSWQFCITGPIQRLLLALLILASRKVGVSIVAWTKMLQRYFSWSRRNIFWAPVGSTIPLVELDEIERSKLRSRLGINKKTPVLAMFSPFGSGKGYDLIEALWKQIGSGSKDVHFILIGATAEEASAILPGLSKDRRVHFIGYIEPAEVSRWLQAADIFLAPFTDGISSRRTSALAAMEHGLPVVTTRGALFDTHIFEKSPLMITDYNSTQFIQATISLIEDRERRIELGKATRAFFEQYFTWSAIVRRLVGE